MLGSLLPGKKEYSGQQYGKHQELYASEG